MGIFSVYFHIGYIGIGYFVLLPEQMLVIITNHLNVNEVLFDIDNVGFKLKVLHGFNEQRGTGVINAHKHGRTLKLHFLFMFNLQETKFPF